MRKHWLLVAVGLLMAVLAVAAIGCGDDDDDDGVDTATATEALDEPTEPADGVEEPTATEEEAEAPNGDGGFTTVVVTENAELGPILTTFDGYTLYQFANDEVGVSNCGAGCVDLWPPLPTAASPSGGEGVPGTLDTITRDDGSVQVTYDGVPLYLYANDPLPGDTNGNGFGGLWSVISIE